MAKLKGLYRRGSIWWFRYTPSKGAPQVRISLNTDVEELAVLRAVEIMQQAPLKAAEDFESEMEAYFRDSQSRRTLSKGLISVRRYVLKSFAKAMGVTRIADLSESLVEAWVKRMGNPKDEFHVQEETAVGYHSHLRAFCSWLVASGKMRENVVAAVKLGKVQKKVRKHFVPADQVRLLIDAAKSDELKFILYCGFHAGMRTNEIAEARPSWFQLGTGNRKGRICVEKTDTFQCKDRDERTIPLSAQFEAFLREYMPKLPSGAQFMLRPDKRHGKHRYRFDFRYLIERHFKACGVRSNRHAMKKSFVSNKLIEDSSLIFKLAKWTGTRVEVLEDHYAHVLADDADIDVGT